MTAGFCLTAALQPANAQGWVADLYAGGTTYHALAERVATTSLIGNLSYQRTSGDVAYVSLAAPLDAAVLWSAAGASGRVGRPGPGRSFGLGLELGAHGYAYRDSDVGVSGGGFTLHALPLLFASRNRFTAEVRGGRHEHFFSFSDTSGRDGLFEVGLRGVATYGAGRAQADVRWLRGPEASFPYAGVQASTSRGIGRAWGWAGKWLSSDLDGAEWGVGGGLTVPGIGEVWLSVREDGGDPLVQSGERRAWNVGLSRRLGASRPRAAAPAPRIEGGSARFRIPESEVPGGTAVPSLAGEFSEWKALPMRREGAEWVLDVPLAAGVYRFAFVSASGEWFVPEGYPGRIDDGMGGHVALVVVL